MFSSELLSYSPSLNICEFVFKKFFVLKILKKVYYQKKTFNDMVMTLQGQR